jgi:hypothetical protein
MRKIMTEEKIRYMERYMENVGMCLDFLDMPYADGSYKTEEEKNRDIYYAFMSEIEFIQEFKGECANDYETRMEYVEKGGFEKDYFSSWLESCSDYPNLIEIKEFCEAVNDGITMWIEAVENDLIDSEEGWRGIRYE